MNMKGVLNWLLVIFIFAGIVSAIIVIFIFGGLVSAAVKSPESVHIEGNVTPAYDEGTFTINWTDGGGTLPANYSIYISTDGGSTYYLKAINDSLTGYSFSNFTQGNYTFIIGAVDPAGPEANSTPLSMFVDRTPPVISLPFYANGTQKENVNYLTLNISASDADSGLTGSSCIVNINGTNQTLTMSNGWCNSSSVYINSTDEDEGNHTIHIWVNDTVGNVGSNDSYVVFVVFGLNASAVCSPSTVYVGNGFPCSCTGNSSVASVVSEEGSSNSPEGIGTPGTVGQYIYTCTVTDSNGASVSSSATYYVNPSQSGSSSILTPHTTQLTAGYNKVVYPGWTFSFRLNDGLLHTLEIKSISSNSSTIAIASTPQTATLNVGQVKEFDILGDGYYDLYVRLNSIDASGESASFTVQTIHEVVHPENQSDNYSSPLWSQPVNDTDNETQAEEMEEKILDSPTGISILLSVVVFLIIMLLIACGCWMHRKKHGKKHKKHHRRHRR